jgi:hypothetical protein
VQVASEQEFTMPPETRIKEITSSGSLADVQKAMDALADEYKVSCDWVRANSQRTEQSLTLFNLLAAASAYLDLLRAGVGAPIQAIALVTRGVYELNLRTRHLLHDPSAMTAWKAELATDKVEILEGLLLFANPESESAARELREEIDRIKAVAKKYALPEKAKPPTVADLAKGVGLEKEHKGLFKLFSKLIHPSSYLVNASQDAHALETRNTLLIHLQLYAVDLLKRLKKELSIPDALPEPKEAKRE